jgi:hypothetical protein
VLQDKKNLKTMHFIDVKKEYQKDFRLGSKESLKNVIT